METYNEFLDRINSFEKAKINFGNEYFKGNPSIPQKVNKDNSFRSFYGDTVVFELDEAFKKQLAEYLDILYGTVPQCFCEKISPTTFHVTLHDLSNSTDLQSIEQELIENERKIIEKAQEIKKHKNEIIKMKSNAVFNMVNTSLVIGLYPSSKKDFNKIMALHGICDDVKKLSYPFYTPHITLAYYNINGFDLRSAEALSETVEKLNEKLIDIDLNVNDLYYQRFTSMNDYVCILYTSPRPRDGLLAPVA